MAIFNLFTMKLKIFILITSIFFISIDAQVLPQYPDGQDFYEGGIKALNREIVKIVKENNLLPCAVGEEYTIPIIIKQDSKIAYVKDFDTVTINKNKCAFNYSRKIIPYLKKWIPAKTDQQNVSAIAKIKIQPFYLYYSKDNPEENLFTNPVYGDKRNGLIAFQQQLSSIFEKRIQANEDKITYLVFIVNTEGGMEDFVIEGNYTENQKRELIKDLLRIKSKWIPGKFNNIPVKMRMRQPIRQNFDFEIEKNRVESAMPSNFKRF